MLDAQRFPRFSAVIIDLDGTLVDTVGDFCAALDQMLATLGFARVERSAVERFIGKGSEHLIRSVLEHAGAPASAYEAAWNAYQAAYREINGRFSHAYPGAAEGLQVLQSAGLRLACLTNKPTAFAQELLASKGLAAFFTAVFGGDAFARKKPDPLPLLRTCDALAAAPGATLVVGDSSNDAMAARAAGCPVVLVTYGYNHGAPVRAVDADGYVDSLTELEAVVPRPPKGSRSVA